MGGGEEIEYVLEGSVLQLSESKWVESKVKTSKERRKEEEKKKERVTNKRR